MCSGLFSSKAPPIYIPPPPKPDPSIAARETQVREQGMQNQAEATRARKKQIQEGFGRRSLLTTSGGGYLSNTKSNTKLG